MREHFHHRTCYRRSPAIQRKDLQQRKHRTAQRCKTGKDLTVLTDRYNRKDIKENGKYRQK